MKRPLLPVALCYVGGLLLAEAVQPPLVYLFGISLALALGAIFSARARGWLLWPLIVFVGWTNLVRHTSILAPHDLRRVAGTEPLLVTVRGHLPETPDLRQQERNGEVFARTLAELRVTAIATNSHWQPATGRIMVSAKGELSPEFFGGREVEIAGVLAPPPPPIAPRLFDYRTYLERQGIYYQLKCDANRDWRALDEKKTPPIADRFRTWAQQTLALGLPEQDEPLRLLWAMTLGWKTALSGEVSEPFMRSGTMHIFAISGLHIALIAGILVALLRVLRVPRTWCGLVVIPLLWSYTGVTGWQPSAIRATIMMTIIVGGWSLRRPSDLLNSLAAAALIILLWKPQQLFQASFQLSFCVVLSIALFLPPLEKLRDRLLALDPLLAPEVLPKWQRASRAVARVILGSLVTSLAAWLGSLPLTMNYFNLFTPVTLLANLFIVPMAGLALACNLGSLICGNWLPVITELFNHGAWFWMTGMVKISEWATEIPGGYFYVAAPIPFTVLIYYGLLIGTLSGWLWRAEQRRRSFAALGVVILFYGGQWFFTRHDAQLTILPLEGGHAEYLDAPGKANDWLIDCGNTNSVTWVTEPFLRARGVNRLPQLLLTHGDLKHIGGTEDLVTEFRCEKIFASSFRFRSTVYRRIIANLQRTPEQLHHVHRGDRIGPWQILHPAADDKANQADDGALVRMAEIHGVKILLLSDLGREGQRQLLDRSGSDLRADIVISGLPTQNEPLGEALLDVIQPRVIIVADSEMPATARAGTRLKERLSRRNVLLLHTRENGAVTVKLRPNAARITTATRQTFDLATLPAMTFPPVEAVIPNPERDE
jgi:competence protein ComEC